jgi:glycyl-tRNA synthetase
MNPATVLRVLGPEPWNVAYIEPSVRPDDGRFGDNPNRMQLHYQLQVILNPTPATPKSSTWKAWKPSASTRAGTTSASSRTTGKARLMGAWGLGWEVWLDGQEITQFTYFQQAGGYDLDPVAVELTYGLERILAPCRARTVWELEWGRDHLWGCLLRSEIEHCELLL